MIGQWKSAKTSHLDSGGLGGDELRKQKNNLTCCLLAVYLGYWAVYLGPVLLDALYFFAGGGG